LANTQQVHSQKQQQQQQQPVVPHDRSQAPSTPAAAAVAALDAVAPPSSMRWGGGGAGRGPGGGEELSRQAQRAIDNWEQVGNGAWGGRVGARGRAAGAGPVQNGRPNKRAGSGNISRRHPLANCGRLPGTCASGHVTLCATCHWSPSHTSACVSQNLLAQGMH
jgi:hypothetical protein